jgi:hypothetical protein
MDYGRGRLWGLAYELSLAVPMYQSSLYRLDRSGPRSIAQSQQEVECLQPPPGHPIVCVATDRAESRLWTVQNGQLVALGSVAGELAGASLTPDGWIAGWLDRQAVVIDPGRAALLVPDGAARSTRAREWTTMENAFGALFYDGSSTRIETFIRE